MGSKSGLSRRSFLQLGAAAAALPVLAACEKSGTSTGAGGSGGGSSEAIKFWNMPWGQTTFNPLDQKITEAYAPASGMPKVTYQVIQWANFNQTFASAVASKTNPAVSSGGGTQVFQFEAQGGISYARRDVRHVEDERPVRRLPARADRRPQGPEGLRSGPVQPRHAGDLVQQDAPRAGRRQGADRLAVLHGRCGRVEEERHLRVRDGRRRRRLHGPARAGLLDDQQRRRSLRREPAAELRHAGEHRGGRLRPRDGVEGLRRPGQRDLHVGQRAEPVEGEEVRASDTTPAVCPTTSAATSRRTWWSPAR